MGISQEIPKLRESDLRSRPGDTGELLEELLESFQALEAELEQQRAENDALVRRLAEQATRLEHQEEAAQLRAENDSLAELVSRYHAQISDLEGQERSLRRALLEQDIEVQRLSERLEQAEDEVRCLETTTRLLESDLSERDETCRQMESELVARERELRLLKTRCGNAPSGVWMTPEADGEAST